MYSASNKKYFYKFMNKKIPTPIALIIMLIAAIISETIIISQIKSGIQEETTFSPTPKTPIEEILVNDPELLYVKIANSGLCGNEKGEMGGCYFKTYLYKSGKLIKKSGFMNYDEPHPITVYPDTDKQLSVDLMKNIIAQIVNSGILTKICFATPVMDYGATYYINLENKNTKITFPGCQKELDEIDKLINGN